MTKNDSRLYSWRSQGYKGRSCDLVIDLKDCGWQNMPVPRRQLHSGGFKTEKISNGQRIIQLLQVSHLS